MKKRMTALCLLTILCCVIGMLAGCSSAKKRYIEDLFHDQGYVYMENTSPTDTEAVTYRLRAKKNSLTAATLRLTLDTDKENSEECKYYDLKMSRESIDETGYYEYWACTVPAQEKSYSYHFMCENEVDKVYYLSSQEIIFDGEPSHRSTDWMTYVNFETPQWTQGSIWYSLMPDSYNNGDITNDKLYNGTAGITTSGNFNTVAQNVWGNTHYSANDWFGGDLQGVAEKTEYFQSLQVDNLQMNPIWYTNHNAGYGAYDLTMLDSAFGNGDSLHALVETLHDSGIKISLDAVLQYYVSTGKITDAADIFPIEITDEDDLYYTVVYDADGNIVAGRWGNDFDFSSEQARNWLYKQPASLIQLYLTEYDVDSWRLDVGAMLRGQQTGHYDTAYAILEDIRKTVKGIDEEIAFISETITAYGVTVDNGVLDSYWNYNYANAVREWAAGNSTIGAFSDVIYTTMVNLPRDEANASYNLLSSHDVWRIADVAMDKNAIKAATLLNMTFVGAPVIYYGDEIGMDSNAYAWLSGQAAPNSFGSFNWNESQWDYEILNYHKSLIQMRKAYGNVFTTGIFTELEVNEGSNYYAFGRVNTDGSVAVVLNQNAETLKDVMLEVRKLSVPDGAVLTDWLTGQQYKVKDGMVTVDVQPGGCALVTANTGSYRNEYELLSIGDGKAEITYADGKYNLSGKSSINGTADSMVLASQPLFSNGYVEAEIQDGAILMLRQSQASDAPFYAAVVADGQIEVWARQTVGAQAQKVASVSAGKIITVAREDANRCVVYVDGQVVEETACTVAELSYKIYGGFAANGEGMLLSLNFNNNSANCAYASFSEGYGSVFNANELVHFEDGKAVLENTQLVTRGTYTDFSVSAAMTYDPAQEGEFAGVLIGKNSLNSYISAGKTKLDGKLWIYAGVVTNGELVIFGKTECSSDPEVVVHLEKVGNYYYARYSGSDLVFAQIPASQMVANYSDIVCGITASGSQKASFDWFRIGGGSQENPRGEFAGGTYGNIALEKDNVGYDAYAQYRVGQGKWEYIENGWGTSDSESMMYLTGKYQYFKTDVTLRFDGGDGESCIDYVFGMQNAGADDGNSVVFRIYKDGRYLLTEGDTLLKTGKLEGFTGEERFVFQCTAEGMLSVYTGENPSVLFFTQLRDYSDGYLLFRANAPWSMLNPNVTNMAQNISILKGAASFTDGRIVMDATTSTYALASVVSEPIGDFIFGANMQLGLSNIYADGFAGILFGTRVGATPNEDGWFVRISNSNQVVTDTSLKNTVYLYHGKEIVASAEVENLHYGSFYLILAVQNGVINIYVDPYNENQTWSTEPVISYDVGYSVGGAISIYAQQANVNFRSYKLYGLKPGEDYTGTAAYTDRAVKKPIIKEPDVSEEAASGTMIYDFMDATDLEGWNRYGGNSELLTDDQDRNIGGLKIDGLGSWYSGAVSTAGKYTNYRISMKLKVLNAGSGWAGLLLNKSDPSDNHEESGILVYATPANSAGKCSVIGYDGAVLGNTGAVFSVDSEGYISLTVQCVDGVLKIYNGSSLVGTWNIASAKNRSGAVSGYVSLVCGNNAAIFKDVKIEVLK